MKMQCHFQEDTDSAKSISDEKVQEVEKVFNENVRQLITILSEHTAFYNYPAKSSYDEALKRVQFLKDVIENKDGYRLFYYKNEPIKREADLQVIYRLTWFSSPFDVNREVNNGRGPVDYTILYGAKDKTLVEFKLASNSKIKNEFAKSNQSLCGCKRCTTKHKSYCILII